MTLSVDNPGAPQKGLQSGVAPLQWSQSNAPATNTQASTVRAALQNPSGDPNNSPRHVCTSISAEFSVDTAGTPARVTLQLLDGAAVIWEKGMSVAGSPVGSRASVDLSGLQIFGSPGQSMTLRFSAAGGANTFESVAMTGYDVA